MTWSLLTIGLGGVTAALAAVAVWQFVIRIRIQRRFAGIVDLEREIEERRDALDAELTARQHVVNAELTAWQQAVSAELTARQQRVESALTARQQTVDAELMARQRAADAALIKQAMEGERARYQATQELAETMRRESELRERYASTKRLYDQLRADLSGLDTLDGRTGERYVAGKRPQRL